MLGLREPLDFGDFTEALQHPGFNLPEQGVRVFPVPRPSVQRTQHRCRDRPSVSLEVRFDEPQNAETSGNLVGAKRRLLLSLEDHVNRVPHLCPCALPTLVQEPSDGVHECVTPFRNVALDTGAWGKDPFGVRNLFRQSVQCASSL
ncbi:MAG: hypothetical protein EBT09_13770 [Actinobacteria bacterium]|nr:hypothetical protein [Actinomycetota bacterium]